MQIFGVMRVLRSLPEGVQLSKDTQQFNADQLNSNPFHDVIMVCGGWSSGMLHATQPEGIGFESDPSHCLATLETSC